VEWKADVPVNWNLLHRRTKQNC